MSNTNQINKRRILLGYIIKYEANLGLSQNQIKESVKITSLPYRYSTSPHSPKYSEEMWSQFCVLTLKPQLPKDSKIIGSDEQNSFLEIKS